jgi:serine/threonine-protein kinase HipA
VHSGQFSLAGAQAKTALHRDPVIRRWGVPWGALPTTHILKPAVTGFDDHDLNEHLCLSAAGHLGLAATSSAVMTFGDERAIVVDRYDRAHTPDGLLRRVHQEDLCQALGVPPTRKYESDGGPSAEQVAGVLRSSVRPASAVQRELSQFLDALAFNWIVGGSDAHAKNYSLLLAGRGVRLAPLYDVASALVYPDLYRPKIRMAMRVGGEYRMAQIRARHWRRLAVSVGTDPDAFVGRIDELATRAADAFATVGASDTVRGLGTDLPGRLLDHVAANAEACREALKG